MLSIYLYMFILRNYIDLEEFISEYSKIVQIGDIEYEYIHKCPFCNENTLHVDVSDADFGNSTFTCYNCNSTGDVIEFYSKLKNTTKYTAILELFTMLKKKHNSEELSDYEFALKIVTPDIFLYDDFKELLEYYNDFITNVKQYQGKDLIEYLCKNSYEYVTLDYYNNPDYIYGLIDKESKKQDCGDYSFLEYISPTLKASEKISKYITDMNCLEKHQRNCDKDKNTSKKEDTMDFSEYFNM